MSFSHSSHVEKIPTQLKTQRFLLRGFMNLHS